MAGNNDNSKVIGIIAYVFMILTCVGAALTAIAVLAVPAIADALITDIPEASGGLDPEQLKQAMVIGYAVGSLIPLAWAIPMTVHAVKCVNGGKPMGMAFKICTLIFVNLLSGILLLFVQNNTTNEAPKANE